MTGPARPTAAHPEPVVLVHGLLGNMTDNWQTMAPLLADNGYCVFALTYGKLPGASFPLDQFGGLLPMVGSTFLQKLDAGAVAPGVTYTNIVTRFDEAVVPYTSGPLTGGNVTNIIVQDQCGLDLSDHLGLAADPIVGRDVLNALDHAHAESPACSLVLPFIG